MFKKKHVGLVLINFVPCTPEVTAAEGLCQKVVRVFLSLDFLQQEFAVFLFNVIATTCFTNDIII